MLLVILLYMAPFTSTWCYANVFCLDWFRGTYVIHMYFFVRESKICCCKSKKKVGKQKYLAKSQCFERIKST